MEEYNIQPEAVPRNICYENYTVRNIYDPRSEYIWKSCMVEYHIHSILQMFLPPFFIVIGSIGNVLAFVVLTRKNIRQWSVCFYLSVYLVTNTLVLYIGCGLEWLTHITSMPHVANLTGGVCRLWQFLFTVILYSSWWLMVGMSLDRFLILWFPSKAQSWCTVFMAKVNTIVIYVGMVVLNIHAMWTYEYTNNHCYPDEDAYPMVWSLVQATLNSYVPTLLIFVFVIAMATGMLMPSVRGPLPPIQEQLTMTTLLTALCFLLLVLPGMTVNLLHYSLTEWVHSHVRRYFKWHLARALGHSMACLNCTLTFLLYFASMPMLRTELKQLLQKIRCSKYAHSLIELNTIEANGDITKNEEPAAVTLL